MVRLPIMARRAPRSLFFRPSVDLLETPFRSLLDEDFFEEGMERGWLPATEVTETDDSIVLTAELPGMRRDDVSIEMEGDVLRIHGEKREEREEEREKDGKLHVSERRYGSFSRAFTVPSSVEAEDITAELKDGILTVTLPKSELARGRTIQIEGD